jgi:presenilin-like A22 family membrane protease
MLGTMFFVVPGYVVDRAEHFLFRSGLQFILAPLLGTLIGAMIGRLASRSHESPAASLLVRAAIAGGIGGFVSLGIVYLNVYAS